MKDVRLQGTATQELAAQLENQFPLPRAASAWSLRVLTVSDGILVVEDGLVSDAEAVITVYTAQLTAAGVGPLTQMLRQVSGPAPASSSPPCDKACATAVTAASGAKALCVGEGGLNPAGCAAYAATKLGADYFCDNVCDQYFHIPKCQVRTLIGPYVIDGQGTAVSQADVVCDVAVKNISVFLTYIDVKTNGQTDEVPIGACVDAAQCHKAGYLKGGNVPGRCVAAKHRIVVHYVNVTLAHEMTIYSDSRPNVVCFTEAKTSVGSLMVPIATPVASAPLPATLNIG